MIGTKSGATIPFTPPWLREAPDAPVFDLRVGSLAERDLFEARLDGEFDAAPVYDFHLRAAAIAGANALGGDDAGELVGLINAGFDDDEPLDDGQRATLVELQSLLHQHWPEYRELRQRAARRQRIMPTLAFMTWCSGWRNVTGVDGQPVEFARGAGGVIDEDAVRRIPDIILAVTGAQCVAMQYGRGEEKNFSPPSGSGGTPGSSDSDEHSATDGSSAASTGQKTRQSRSPAGHSA